MSASHTLPPAPESKPSHSKKRKRGKNTIPRCQKRQMIFFKKAYTSEKFREYLQERILKDKVNNLSNLKTFLGLHMKTEKSNDSILSDIISEKRIDCFEDFLIVVMAHPEIYPQKLNKVIHSHLALLEEKEQQTFKALWNKYRVNKKEQKSFEDLCEKREVKDEKQKPLGSLQLPIKKLRCPMKKIMVEKGDGEEFKKELKIKIAKVKDQATGHSIQKALGIFKVTSTELKKQSLLFYIFFYRRMDCLKIWYAELSELLPEQGQHIIPKKADCSLKEIIQANLEEFMKGREEDLDISFAKEVRAYFFEIPKSSMLSPVVPAADLLATTTPVVEAKRYSPQLFLPRQIFSSPVPSLDNHLSLDELLGDSMFALPSSFFPQAKEDAPDQGPAKIPKK